ncbi:uracil-DNA glycosylase [Dethiosulfatarculus sandiegensis]|uniref:Type-4 uracil-DNA glycosylase n=1 Tax=Dethiosulfatarculus sandiegensis TaxID=1429043 RepID=A0A0D2HNM2_9BACT|nr:uracil-DNA glycosylase [Dethiosulfatarculus sandiegensis]KIX12173.1 DNA polymerase [Dethiosulfatarculus sandiegensis]
MDLRLEIAALRENLACRKRLGLGLVQGGEKDLDLLLDSLLAKGCDDLGLESLEAGMGQCNRCPLGAARKNLVFGRGREKARIFLISGPPGALEDENGLPLAGDEGLLIANMLKVPGLGLEQVYASNLVKCRPPRGMEVDAESAKTCLGFLDRQIKAVDPGLIVILGAFAARILLSVDFSLEELRGKVHDYQGIKTIVTFQPGDLLHEPRKKAAAYQDLKFIAGLL